MTTIKEKDEPFHLEMEVLAKAKKLIKQHIVGMDPIRSQSPVEMADV